jgi:hypothetical protein
MEGAPWSPDPPSVPRQLVLDLGQGVESVIENGGEPLPARRKRSLRRRGHAPATQEDLPF